MPSAADTKKSRPASRSLRTVRISVAARCDLDCVYCDADEDAAKDAGTNAAGRHELSVDEIVLLAEAAGVAGASTVRLTGGEPLLRDDIEEAVSRIRSTGCVTRIALTTNAQRLAPRARALKEAGLDRVNIGLPSLVPATYRRMTKGELAPAAEGLEAALAAGLSPVKVNVVLIRGMNADEIGAFTELARSRSVEVRFLELMPFCIKRMPAGGADSLVPASETRSAIAASLGVGSLGEPAFSATAEFYRPRGFAGQVGLISPVTAPFCERCDRLRVTSDGRLRACLSEPDETDLRPMLDSGAPVEALARAMREEFDRKPERHRATFRGPMRRIGG